MRLGNKIYRGTVAARELFERMGIGPLVSLAKHVVESVSRIVTVDGGIRLNRPGKAA